FVQGFKEGGRVLRAQHSSPLSSGLCALGGVWLHGGRKKPPAANRRCKIYSVGAAVGAAVASPSPASPDSAGGSVGAGVGVGAAALLKVGRMPPLASCWLTSSVPRSVEERPLPATSSRIAAANRILYSRLFAVPTSTETRPSYKKFSSLISVSETSVMPSKRPWVSSSCMSSSSTSAAVAAPLSGVKVRAEAVLSGERNRPGVVGWTATSLASSKISPSGWDSALRSTLSPSLSTSHPLPVSSANRSVAG